MSINILDELKQDFLVYAQEVNQNRSFCDCRDGLKPSQRAALYTMFRKGFTSDKPHVKSAKITGAIIGELWPHGDGSAYESIVRMSQNWINNIPEIDFHGANGSLLGGPESASSRYTECRLSKAVEDGFFSNIKKNVVDMIPNFSEDDEWPKVLPAIFPRLFVNGSQGIGYTIAQEWEPGNLNEFVEKVKQFISTNKLTFDNIYPDYPTGGVIVNKADLHAIYETGRGSVILRGKADIAGKYINITELPYQVYAEPFIQKVKDLVNAGTLSGIEDICNKSDDNGLLIEIESSIDPNIILQKLYKLTDLQCTFSANQMALVDGIPQMLNLQDYVKVYVDHNLECLQREYQFDLDKAEARKEVVDGLIQAISIIDDIIKIIKASKSSDDAKKNLISQFSFTENQAKAIVDMKLGKLANLEIIELNKELNELIKTIDRCTKFLSSNSLQKKEFIKRLEDFTAKYGWERRTEVIDINIEAEKQMTKVIKAEEKYVIALTKGNMIKRMTIDDANKKQKALSDLDTITHSIEVNEKDMLILISASGKMYKLCANKISLCTINASGTSLDKLLSDKIVAIYSGTEEENYLFMITKNGLAKKIESNLVFKLSKNIGAPIMKVEENDEIIYCECLNSKQFTLNNGKKDKVINTDDFISKGRSAGGVRAITLTKNNYCVIK